MRSIRINPTAVSAFAARDRLASAGLEWSFAGTVARGRFLLGYVGEPELGLNLTRRAVVERETRYLELIGA